MTCSLRLTIGLFAVLTQGVSGIGDDNVPVSIPAVGETLQAADTLERDVDVATDAQDCLVGLRWTPADFTIRC